MPEGIRYRAPGSVVYGLSLEKSLPEIFGLNLVLSWTTYEPETEELNAKRWISYTAVEGKTDENLPFFLNSVHFIRDVLPLWRSVNSGPIYAAVGLSHRISLPEVVHSVPISFDMQQPCFPWRLRLIEGRDTPYGDSFVYRERFAVIPENPTRLSVSSFLYYFFIIFSAIRKSRGFTERRRFFFLFFFFVLGFCFVFQGRKWTAARRWKWFVWTCFKSIHAFMFMYAMYTSCYVFL